jgi:hypothetical protein
VEDGDAQRQVELEQQIRQLQEELARLRSRPRESRPPESSTSILPAPPPGWVWNEVVNDTAGWHEVSLVDIQPTQGAPLPIRLFINRFKSSSSDCEAFIHDPIGELIKAGDQIEAFQQINRSWKLSTLVANHDRTLSVTHLPSIVVIDPTNPGAALLTTKVVDPTAP